MRSVIVKKSKINKQGVFANRNFNKDEVVLRWKPKEISKLEFQSLSTKEKDYVVIENDKYFLMQEPERYVNHSCDPNTHAKDQCDVASRNIKKGEEITSDYSKIDSPDQFQCNCGSDKCRKVI